ncbi:hypothetical protein LTR95_000646 [Oleoguttula sp. CCFEE 5521]
MADQKEPLPDVFPFLKLPQELQDKIHEHTFTVKKYRLDVTAPLVTYAKPNTTLLLVSRRFASDYVKTAEHTLRFITNVEDLDDVMKDPHTVLELTGIPYHEVSKLEIILTNKFNIWHADYLETTTQAGSDLAIRLAGFKALKKLHVALRSPRALTCTDIAGFVQQLFATVNATVITVAHIKTSVETGRNVMESVMVKR